VREQNEDKDKNCRCLSIYIHVVCNSQVKIYKSRWTNICLSLWIFTRFFYQRLSFQIIFSVFIKIWNWLIIILSSYSLSQKLTFSYFNCFPQNRRLNRGVWKIWETTIRQESQKWPLRIYCGGIYTNAINRHSIGIPTYCWKLVINLKTHLISHVLLFKNDDSNSVQRISFSDLKKLLNYTVDFKTN
jgi:hypothetical protein